MSEDFTAVVRLDSVDRAREAASLVAFLVAEGVVVPNPSVDELWRPSDWVAGPGAPRVLAAFARNDDWLNLANNGVDVVAERAEYVAMENDEPSACPACGTRLEEERYWDLLGMWGEAAEPEATCRSCGLSSLLGDWRNEWPSVFGGPAVTFNNWPPMEPAFLERVRQELGGRTVVVRAHY